MKLQIEDASAAAPASKNASAITFGTVFRGSLGTEARVFEPEAYRLYLCTGSGIVDLAEPGQTFPFEGGKLRVYNYREVNAKLYVQD